MPFVNISLHAASRATISKPSHGQCTTRWSLWESFDVRVDQVIESADYLVAQLTNTAVLKATGKTVVIQNAWVFEAASGRVASAQLYADTAAVRSGAG